MAAISARRAAFLLLLTVPIFFASNNIAARLADGVVPPAALALSRWSLAGILLAPGLMVALSRNWAAVKAEWRHLLALGFIGMCLASIATYAGAKTTTASNIGLIFASTPAVILLMDWMMSGVRLGLWQVAGSLMSIGGIVYIVMRGELSAVLEAQFSRGDLIVCGGMLAWATYSVLLKYWPSRLTVMERASAIALAGALTTLPFALLESAAGATISPGWPAFWIILCVGVVAGAAVITAHAFITDQLGPRVAVVLLYLIPIYNIALAWMLLGEELEIFQAVGGVAVLLGVVLATGRPGSGELMPGRRAS